MCWTISQMRQLEREHPRLGELFTALAKTSEYTRKAVAERTITGPIYSGKRAVLEEYSIYPGELWDYGDEEFHNPKIRQEVAMEMIQLARSELN